MDDKFLPKLSQNLLEILDDDEYYDVNIEVGNDLQYMLKYFILSFSLFAKNFVKKNDGTLVHIKLANILSEISNNLRHYKKKRIK